MKLIALNAWGGKLYEPLIQFVKAHSNEVDIFCFQEMLFGEKAELTPIYKGRTNIFEEICKALPDFLAVPQSYGESHFVGERLPADIGFGQAIFVRKSFPVLDHGGFKSAENLWGTHPELVGGKFQWANVETPDGQLTVVNVHGAWQKGSGKRDTPEREAQSRIAQDFLASVSGKKILCGDFNLAADGESIKMLERDMTNLNREYGLMATRSSHYAKPEKSADYILVSPDITVNEFKVLPDEVSDHLALYIDFE